MSTQGTYPVHIPLLCSHTQCRSNSTCYRSRLGPLHSESNCPSTYWNIAANQGYFCLFCVNIQNIVECTGCFPQSLLREIRWPRVRRSSVRRNFYILIGRISWRWITVTCVLNLSIVVLGEHTSGWRYTYKKKRFIKAKVMETAAINRIGEHRSRAYFFLVQDEKDL